MSIYLPIAGLSISLPLLVAMGLAVGVLSGMFGIGGGFIITPLLIFLGVPPSIAVGTGAAQVVASSVTGAIGHWRREAIDVRMGLLLLAGGVGGSALGVMALRQLRAAGQLDLTIAMTYVVVLGTIGTLMLVEAIGTLRRAPASGREARRAGQQTWLQALPLKVRFHRSKLYASALPPVLIGVLVGLLTAIMGVGGGFLVVPALIYLLRVPTRIAIGTSVFQIVFLTAVTTVLQSVGNGSVDVLLAVPLMVGSVVGAHFGVEIGQRLDATHLRGLLAMLVLMVAARMGVDLALKPADLFTLEAVPP